MLNFICSFFFNLPLILRIRLTRLHKVSVPITQLLLLNACIMCVERDAGLGVLVIRLFGLEGLEESSALRWMVNCYLRVGQLKQGLTFEEGRYSGTWSYHIWNGCSWAPFDMLRCLHPQCFDIILKVSACDYIIYSDTLRVKQYIFFQLGTNKLKNLKINTQLLTISVQTNI